MAKSKTKAPPVSKNPLRPLLHSRYFPIVYAVTGLVILLASTIFWSVLSAKVHQTNADQLVDPLLFNSADEFRGAQFPGAHTFLFKWPVFYIVKLFGFTATAYLVTTVAIVTITVAILAYILYRIDKRPLVFGTLCLALASVLMLVPSTPSAGALLPVNMAMLATRNLEYVLYIAALICIVRAKSLRSYWTLGGIATLGLLAASDRLFLYISLGGALIGLIVYAFVRGWNIASFSVNWLVAGFMAAVATAGLYWLFSNIMGSSDVGPYGLIHSVKDGILGVFYAVSSLLTNFGANPAFHTSELARMPGATLRGLISVGGPAFIVNALVLTGGAYAIYRLARTSLAHNRNKRTKFDAADRLALMLTLSTLAAIGIFIASKHYYAADARYLTIALFTVFVGLATYARKKKWSVERLSGVGAILCLCIVLGGIVSVQSYHKDQGALRNVRKRDSLVTKALSYKNVDVMVGDYWRSVPVRVISDNRINILPLANCTLPRDVLTSKDWNKDLNSSSFAYLLSLDKSLTDFPTCSLDQVIDTYGRPNASLVIEGTLEKPQELLLFYEGGSHASAPLHDTEAPSTVTPIPLSDLPDTSCDGPTIMNIVAHQDDDILFMNPDLLANIKRGYCIRTVYLTAGDAGADSFYWLKREQGAQAAYDHMLGQTDTWVNRIVRLNGSAFVNVASPRGNDKVSLLFLHLPDGNMQGQGFGSSHYENLERLESGSIDRIHAIDGSATYSSDELITALSQLMGRYMPTEINTQSGFAGTEFNDHSDHMAVGHFARKAYEKFETEQFDNKIVIPFKYYMGYPGHEQPENIMGADFNEKLSIFLSYAKFDLSVCQDQLSCETDPAYGSYLRRQYQHEN
jgi:LmbE family N-acetylglucosaminyl deacetylase